MQEKYVPKITPYLETFHAVIINKGLHWMNKLLSGNKNFSRFISRLLIGSHSIPNLHKWVTWWNKINQQKFCWGTSIFSKIKNKSCSPVELNDDVKIISNLNFQRKILFNPDPNKQAVETRSCKKIWEIQLPAIDFQWQ